MDRLIGKFIATYDEAAAGCLLDADTAEALAKEFKRMNDKIVLLEETMEDILIDDGGIFAADPSRWPSYRAAKALLGRELTQEEFKIYQQQLLAKRKIERE